MTLRIGKSTYPDVSEERVREVSRNERAKILTNGLAELIVFGIHLKEAGLYGSYDLVREVTVQLQRQYQEFMDEESV